MEAINTLSQESTGGWRSAVSGERCGGTGFWPWFLTRGGSSTEAGRAGTRAPGPKFGPQALKCRP